MASSVTVQSCQDSLSSTEMNSNQSLGSDSATYGAIRVVNVFLIILLYVRERVV
jgi:hypothetical protein